MKAKMWNLRIWIPESEVYYLKKLYVEPLKECGFGVMKEMEHHFTPYGYTGIWLLSESHLAIHTFPEHGINGMSYLELTSCVEKPFRKYMEMIKNTGLRYSLDSTQPQSKEMGKII